MSISYLRVCNDGGCEVHPYKQTVNIFFNGMSNFFISMMLWSVIVYPILILILKVTKNTYNILKCIWRQSRLQIAFHFVLMWWNFATETVHKFKIRIHHALWRLILMCCLKLFFEYFFFSLTYCLFIPNYAKLR